jgi:hypothetical protein
MFTFCGVLLQQTQSKTSPPRFCSIFRVLNLKTLKIGREVERKKGTAAGAFIGGGTMEASIITETDSINTTLMEAVSLKKPPPLMY